MKIRIIGLLAFNLAMFFAITRERSGSLAGTMIPVIALFAANMVLVFVFRFRQSPRDNSLGGVSAMFRLTHWTSYIPVVGGVSAIVIGAIDRSWKLSLVGFLGVVARFFSSRLHEFRGEIA